jgi:hypothetical protein
MLTRAWISQAILACLVRSEVESNRVPDVRRLEGTVSALVRIFPTLELARDRWETSKSPWLIVSDTTFSLIAK